MACSGQVRSDHGDGGSGGALVSLRVALWLTELYQRALGGVVECWGGSGAVAVMEKRLGQPVTGNGDGGERRCCCGRCQRRRRRQNAKMEARLSAGGCWGDNAVLRRVVACVVRATATRGRRGHHTACKLCFCRPLTTANSVGSALVKPTNGPIWRGTNF